MGAGKAGQRGEQCLVVLERLGHFVVEALVVLTLDSVDAELNSLRDEQPSVRSLVVVGELHRRYGDPKSGRTRQRGESHFRRHLCLSAVTRRVVEVAREFGEQVGVQIRLGTGVFN
jgi:hypothetical protein